MRETIDMAREVYGAHTEWTGAPLDRLEQLVALVRADERNRTWTQEHWTEYERSIAAQEREACAKVCDVFYCDYCADAIRNMGNT
jgi:hypothetical protein